MVNINIPTEYLLYGGASIVVIGVFYYSVGKITIWYFKNKNKRIKESKSKTITETKIVERYVDSKGKRFDDIDKNEFYFKAKPYTYFWRSRWTWRGYKDRRMLKKFPDKVILVRFEMNNGTHREFLIKDDASAFVFRNARYVLDLEDRYWVVDSNIWAYDFHESISISVTPRLKPNPELLKYIKELEENSKKSINKKIPVNELKETIEQSGVSEVENSINPIVLERLIKSEIVQA